MHNKDFFSLNSSLLSVDVVIKQVQINTNLTLIEIIELCIVREFSVVC